MTNTTSGLQGRTRAVHADPMPNHRVHHKTRSSGLLGRLGMAVMRIVGLGIPGVLFWYAGIYIVFGLAAVACAACTAMFVAALAGGSGQ